MLISAFLFAAVCSTNIYAQSGYSIQVRIDGFEQKELYLGYYLGDKQYLRDTAVQDAKGNYIFSDTAALPAGVYILVLPPENNFFQILIPEKGQHFSMQTKLDQMTEQIQFKGSPENTAFYDYLNYLSERNKEADPINKALEASQDTVEKTRLKKTLS